MPQPLFARRRFAACLLTLCLGLPAPAAAGLIGPQIKNILLKASDRALDKLAKPSAFVTDNRVRIVLPGDEGYDENAPVEVSADSEIPGNFNDAVRAVSLAANQEDAAP